MFESQLTAAWDVMVYCAGSWSSVLHRRWLNLSDSSGSTTSSTALVSASSLAVALVVLLIHYVVLPEFASFLVAWIVNHPVICRSRNGISNVTQIASVNRFIFLNNNRSTNVDQCPGWCTNYSIRFVINRLRPFYCRITILDKLFTNTFLRYVTAENVAFCYGNLWATVIFQFLSQGQHWLAKTLTPNSLPPNMDTTGLCWSEVPRHCWDCTVVIRMWNSSEEFR